MSASQSSQFAAEPINSVPAVEAAFGAYVTGTVIDIDGVAAFALGDGSVRFQAGDGWCNVAAHTGAILCMAAHPRGGVVTGGDDGALNHTQPDGGITPLYHSGAVWIETVAASHDSQSLACGAGRELVILEANGRVLTTPRRMAHATTVTGLAFDSKGKRLAAAHYGGVSVWWAASESQTPLVLPWRGSHLGASFSPDGRYVVSAMQENALHGWRLADKAHFRMTGFAAKIKSMSWQARGRWLITSGANQGLVWTFEGKQGPMGRDARPIGHDGIHLVTCVAAHPTRDVAAIGYADGSIALAQAAGDQTASLRQGDGAAITAMAWSSDGLRLAAGSESGFAAVLSFKREAL